MMSVPAAGCPLFMTQHGDPPGTNQPIGWRFADNRKGMSAFQKGKKTSVCWDDSRTCSDTSFWEVMGQASAQRVFSTVTKGVATLQLTTVTWAGVAALGSAAARVQRCIPLSALPWPAPLLCQKMESHLYSDVILTNPCLHDCKPARAGINFCGMLKTNSFAAGWHKFSNQRVTA